MKKIYALILVLAVGFSLSALYGADGTAAVSLRPTHVFLKADTAQGAVLVTLSGYTVNDVRYRLYNGSNQYNCWDNTALSFTSATSYSAGPVALGTPSTSSTFWIVFQRGTNNTVSASYRDRIGPTYPANNNTVALPAATAITEEYVLSGKLTAAGSYTLAQKYVVLAWNGSALVSATSSYITSGAFSVFLPVGTSVDKIEVRTLQNTSINEVTGSWSATTTLADLLLFADPAEDAKLSDIDMNAADLPGFNAALTNYAVELPAGTTAVPVITATTSNPAATAVVTPATDLLGNTAARTTTILVTAANGTTKKTYSIVFNPILEIANLAAFRTGDPTRTYVVKSDLLITYMNATRYQKFIQDASGAVMIDDPSHVITTTYAVGDIITNLKGKILTYAGLIEFAPSADPGAPKSSGNSVVPELITIAQLNANIGLYESKYIKLQKVRFLAANGTATFSSAANYSITDGVNNAVVRTNYADLNYIGGVIPVVVDLAGVTTSFNGAMQVIPRYATDFLKIYSSVASLSDLKVSGQTVTGFAANTLTYTRYLAPTTTVVPEVTYTTTNAAAAAVVTNATNLAGDEAARTTTIAVTAEDGLTVINYKVVFVLGFPTAIAKQAVSAISVYPVPANDQITISGLSRANRLELMDVTGKLIRKVEITGNEVILNISDLHKGMYFLRTDTETLKFIKK